MSTRVPTGKNQAIQPRAVVIGPGRPGGDGIDGMIETIAATAVPRARTTAFITSVTPVLIQQIIWSTIAWSRLIKVPRPPLRPDRPFRGNP